MALESKQVSFLSAFAWSTFFLLLSSVVTLGVLACFWAYAAPRDPERAATVLADLKPDMTRCAAGSSPGQTATLTVRLAAGEPRTVTVNDGNLEPQVAACILDLVGSAPWPAVTTTTRTRIEVR
jgi:hypothetical protein